MTKKLKPVVYETHTFKRGAPNTTQQMLLLKAMQVSDDPKEWRRLIGVKTVADVYRTLDKLAIRKEYHAALAKAGISFDFLVENLKGIVEKGEKDGDRIKAVQTIMKSIGIDQYGNDVETGGSWEDVLMKKLSEAENQEESRIHDVIPEYTVKQPEVPDVALEKQKEDKELSNIYE